MSGRPWGAVAAVLLAACSGGGGGSPPPACTRGAACELAGLPCAAGAIQCGAAGATCVATGSPVDPGTRCGVDGLCDGQGACVECQAGLVCVPADACQLGATACAQGVPRCVATGAPADPGTRCGLNGLCDGQGACVECQAGLACVPADACHLGTTACAAGAPSCQDTGGAAPDGTPCGSGLACLGGACAPAVALPPLEARCTADTAGRVPVLTVLARANPAAGAVSTPIPATVAAASAAAGTITGAFTIAGSGLGLGEIRGAGLAVGSVATVRATVDGVARAVDCTAEAGLPAVTPTAANGAGTFSVTWPPVAGATAYRVALIDPASDQPAAEQLVAASPATFAGALDVTALTEIRVAALSVTAEAPVAGALPSPAASHESFLFSSGSAAGGGAAWRVYRPADFSGATLTASFAALGPAEQVAVLLVNAGGDDGFVPTVTASGTGPAPALLAGDGPAPELSVAGAAADAAPDRDGMAAAREALRRWDEARLAGQAASAARQATAPAARAAAPAAPGDTRTFCHARFQLVAGAAQIVVVRRTATLRAISPAQRAQFWVADEVWSALQTTVGDTAAFFGALGAAYDGPIRTALGTYFGQESDVDGNGQMIFVFANLGSVGSAFPVGYFTAGDMLPLDAACTGSASNHADALYLTDPATFVSMGFGLAAVRDVEYPGTMAHELQHDVNYNERCVKVASAPTCAQLRSEEDWINEGLSMVSEDAAGYGLASTASDAEARRVGGWLRVERDYALTLWEGGDPIGNYGGVHAFMRYWLDQEGPDFTRRMVSSGLSGRTGVERVLGRPLEAAMIRFADASLFSGEAFSPLPAWDYAVGTAWAPWHQALKWVDTSGPTAVLRTPAYVDYTPLPLPAGGTFKPLRTDGWGAYLTGKGTGATATVTVSTAAARKPHVVVVRFAGTLPRR